MGYKFSPEASQELHDAYLWYEEHYPGLGQNFIQEIKSSIQTILKFPTGWPLVGKYTRRCLLLKIHTFCYTPMKTMRFTLLVLGINTEIQIFIIQKQNKTNIGVQPVCCVAG